jgi:hypothetical protein
MNSRRSFSTLALILVCAGCASGTADQPTAPAAEAGAAPVPAQLERAKPEVASSRLVCRRERETGSRVARRVCRTQSEWERARVESLEPIERNRQQSTSATTLTD